MLELKECLHCDPNVRHAVHDPGFTREAIAMQKDKEPLSAQILCDKALKVIANCKHALKHCTKWLDAMQNEPASTKLEDMLLCV